MKVLNEILENKKRLLIIITVIILCICIFLYDNSSIISRKDKKKNYVYTVMKYRNVYYGDEVYDEIPAINLVGDKFDKINKSIVDNYNSVVQMNEYDYDYEYSISGSILALKITYAYYENSESLEPTRYFQTIHVDLKTGKILSDDDILSRFNATKADVYNVLDKDFRIYYKNLVDGKFYTEEECNYSCFLSNRGITDDYTDGVSYYIQDGMLTVFKFFNRTSKYKEEEYFYDEDYQFIVKK